MLVSSGSDPAADLLFECLEPFDRGFTDRGFAGVYFAFFGWRHSDFVWAGCFFGFRFLLWRGGIVFEYQWLAVTLQFEGFGRELMIRRCEDLRELVR